jgi:hypothetical protein
MAASSANKALLNERIARSITRYNLQWACANFVAVGFGFDIAVHQ